MIGAVDIGGTKIAAGVLDESGRVLARAESPTRPQQGPQAGLQQVCDLLRQAAAECGGQLSGIGIGCTGPVDPFSGELGRIEFLPGWEGMNLPALLSQAFGVPAAIENDADAAALGEAAWGAGQGARRFIYLTISTGIGGGMVLDGQLYRGADGAHPEMGHHVIDPSGPPCFCGAHGCWESLASGPALALRGQRATAREVCLAAEAGDPAARQAVAREGFYLGLGLANLVTLLMPDVIALGGGVMQSRHLFWDQVHAIIRATCGLVPYEKTRLLPARLGRDVGLAGAAQVWLKRVAS